jgi:hypothetical protein
MYRFSITSCYDSEGWLYSPNRLLDLGTEVTDELGWTWIWKKQREGAIPLMELHDLFFLLGCGCRVLVISTIGLPQESPRLPFLYDHDTPDGQLDQSHAPLGTVMTKSPESLPSKVLYASSFRWLMYRILRTAFVSSQDSSVEKVSSDSGSPVLSRHSQLQADGGLGQVSSLIPHELGEMQGFFR